MMRNISIECILAAVFLMALVSVTRGEQENGNPSGEGVIVSEGKEAKELEVTIGENLKEELAAILQKARTNSEEGNFDAAIAEYQKLLEDYPLDVRLTLYCMRKIANCYQHKNDISSAIEEYHRIKTLAQTYSFQTIVEDAQYNLGFCYLIKAQRTGEGCGCGREREEISKEAAAEYEIALAQLKPLLDYSTYTYDISRLHSIAEGIIECYRMLGREGELDQFLAEYRQKFPSSCRRVIAQRPNTSDAAEAQFYLGVFYLKEGQYDIAKEELSKVVDMKAAKGIQPGAHGIIAWILKHQGYYQEAIQKYQNISANSDPEIAAGAQLEIARIYYLSRDETKTRVVLREIIKVYPDSQAAYEASMMLKGMDLVKQE